MKRIATRLIIVLISLLHAFPRLSYHEKKVYEA